MIDVMIIQDSVHHWNYFKPQSPFYGKSLGVCWDLGLNENNICVNSNIFHVVGPLEQFDSWLSTFSLDEKKGDISELLVNSPSIRALYTKMVWVMLLICFLIYFKYIYF